MGLVTRDLASAGRKSEATLKERGEAAGPEVALIGGGIDRDGINGRCECAGAGGGGGGGGGEYGRLEYDSLRECIGERAVPFRDSGLDAGSREEGG